MGPTNPYAAAAVRKQRALRAMRLPSAQAADYPRGEAATTFLEGLGVGGPRASMMKNILCSAAARRMSEADMAAVLAHLAAQGEREADALLRQCPDAPEAIVRNCRRHPGLVLAERVIGRERARRA